MATNEATEINFEDVDKILVFSFDLIARITPGIAIIFICFQTSLNDTVPTSLAEGAVILIVAYLIGITADILLNRAEVALGISPMGTIIGLMKKCSPAEQMRITKLLAEAVLFRSCAVLCVPLFVLKAPLIVKFTDGYITNGSGRYYYACVIAALIVVFVVCHFDRRKQLRHEEANIQNEDKEPKKETHLDQSADAAHKFAGTDNKAALRQMEPESVAPAKKLARWRVNGRKRTLRGIGALALHYRHGEHLRGLADSEAGR
jgi:hypothetical protein